MKRAKKEHKKWRLRIECQERGGGGGACEKSEGHVLDFHSVGGETSEPEKFVKPSHKPAGSRILNKIPAVRPSKR